MKKASLELSVNAIVVIVIAITMLGLGLGFLRGIFSNSLGQVEEQLKGLQQQRIDALKADCNEGLCLESTKVDIKRNEQKDIWAVLYNKFDCNINEVKIYIGGQQGGSGNFGNNACNMIETEGSKCSDIQITSVKSKKLDQKKKEAVLLRIKATSGAKLTVYDYDIKIDGSCSVGSTNFNLNDQLTLTVNVEG
ncbi:MAG: hypothetical protein QW474_03810 [Candidatus Aenigmatarchaeota archaeon]